MRIGVSNNFRARLGAVLLAVFVACEVQPADSGWKPESPVEMVVGQGPGGGTDRNARLIQRILREQQLTEAPVTVINKPGAGGAMGLNYLAKRPADGHTIALGNATLLSTHIVGRSALTYTDVTPIALLTREYVAFAVKSDSPLKSGKDLLDRLKQDPASVSIAIGAAFGNQNHVAISLAAKSVGADVRKLKTVIFKSGGETVTAILGGHVDIGMTSSSTFVRHVQAGTLRVIAVSAPQRLHGELAGVPTWQEQGADSIAGNWYAVYGPKNMESARLRYWSDAFAALVRTEEWKQDAMRRYISVDYRNSEDTQKFFSLEYAKLKDILTELGLAR